MWFLQVLNKAFLVITSLLFRLLGAHALFLFVTFGAFFLCSDDLKLLKMSFSVISPGFHALYLESMVKVFTNCSGRTISKFEELLERKGLQGGEAIELNLEAEFSSLALDIIGLGVFNYDFGSVTKESPIIKVYISCILSQIPTCALKYLSDYNCSVCSYDVCVCIS